jgi:hypothetical protein
MNNNKVALKKYEIPYMSNIEIINYYKTIRPIKRTNGTSYYLRELIDKELTEVSYTWIEKDDTFHEVDYNQLSAIKEIKVLHKYDHFELFKPSVGEVISQIPNELLNIVVAFEIIKYSTPANDFNSYHEEFDAGFHVSIVRLYSKKV